MGIGDSGGMGVMRDEDRRYFARDRGLVGESALYNKIHALLSPKKTANTLTPAERQVLEMVENFRERVKRQSPK